MKDLYKDRLLIAVTAFAYIQMIAINALANIIPIGGMNSGQVSDAYPNLFAPIGYTFSIWSVIYTLLFAFTLYVGFTFWDKGFAGKMYLHRTLTIFTVSSFINSAWILAWHYQIMWLTLMLMTGILYSLIRINWMLSKRDLDNKEDVLVRLPFSVYFGWISVATIANVTVLLVDLEWNRFGLQEDIVTAVVLVVGALIGMAAIKSYNSLAYGLVILWAYAGILAKHTSALYFNSDYPLIINTLIVTMVLVAAFELYTGARRIHWHRPMHHVG